MNKLYLTKSSLDYPIKVERLLFFLLTIVFLSCTPRPDPEIAKGIIGEWKFVECSPCKKGVDAFEYPPPFGEGGKGFTFYDNDSCENLIGFYELTPDTSWRSQRIVYHGNETSYKIASNQLFIWDLFKKEWEMQEVIQVDSDSLLLMQNDSSVYRFVKNKQNLKGAPSFDTIIVSSGMCFGGCEVSDIRIDRKGDVVFYGDHYNTINGLYRAAIGIETFKKIERAFTRANSSELKKAYSNGSSDGQTNSITLIKNDSIVMSIEDFNFASPSELIWAYYPIKFLYQQLELENQDSSFIPPLTYFVRYEKANNIGNLSKSEGFYLWSELNKSKVVKHDFEPIFKFSISHLKEKENVVFTDGRYYEFRGITVDLGYNFFARNDLEDRMGKKGRLF